MRFIAGIIVGLILGAAGAAGAQSGGYWFSGAKVLGQDATFQNGYVAGMYDGFSNARSLLEYGLKINTPASNVLSVMTRYVACMDRHSATLGEFKSWAATQWTNYQDNDKYSAAAVMLSSECRSP